MGGKEGGLTSGAVQTSPVGENGGAGTSFLYHMVHKHRTLYIDNGGRKVSLTECFILIVTVTIVSHFTSLKVLNNKIKN